MRSTLAVDWSWNDSSYESRKAVQVKQINPSHYCSTFQRICAALGSKESRMFCLSSTVNMLQLSWL